MGSAICGLQFAPFGVDLGTPVCLKPNEGELRCCGKEGRQRPDWTRGSHPSDTVNPLGKTVENHRRRLIPCRLAEAMDREYIADIISVAWNTPSSRGIRPGGTLPILAMGCAFDVVAVPASVPPFEATG